MESELPLRITDPAWEITTLGELCEQGGGGVQTGPFGSQLHADDYVDDGVPVIMPQDLVDGRIDPSDIARISEDDADRLGRHRVREGDIVYSRRGDLRRRVLIKGAQEGWLCGTGCLRVRVGAGARSEYLTAYLGHPAIQAWIERHAVGATMLNLNTKILSAVPVALPPPDEQGRIASVLGALDDKIDSNWRLARFLEEVAQAEFQARFVDFVGADSLGETEIGPVSEDWRVEPFSAAVEINPKVGVRKGEATPFVAMADVAPWATRPDSLGERPYTGGCRFEPGDTLMARITGCIEHGKGAFVDFVDQPAAGSTEFLVLRAKPPLTPEAVFFLSRTERVRAHAIANMGGSSGRQRVQTAAFDDLRVAVPPDAESWSDTAEVFRIALEQTHGLWRETRVLSAIRDDLLPRLVTGELRVPDSTDPRETIEPPVEEHPT
jgi:type I restriction enzyme, S subunit